MDHDRGVLSQAQIDLARYKEAFAFERCAKQVLDDQEQIVIQDQGAVTISTLSRAVCSGPRTLRHIAIPTSARVGLRLVDSGNPFSREVRTPLV